MFDLIANEWSEVFGAVPGATRSLFGFAAAGVDQLFLFGGTASSIFAIESGLALNDLYEVDVFYCMARFQQRLYQSLGFSTAHMKPD